MAERPCSQSSSAIEHLSQSFERLTQLLALLSSSPAKPNTTAPAIVLVDKAICSIASALSELQTSPPCRIDSPTAAEDSRSDTDPQKRSKRRIQSWTIVTSVPHFDGHQWRKYGQKRIHSSNFPKSYYKCTHNKDQACQATKTIQQKDDEILNSQKYVVSYSGHHTCKVIETREIPFIMDSSTFINEHSTFNSQATSPDLSATSPLQVVDNNQVSLMESMFLSAESTGEMNCIEGSSIMPPLAAFDFDWECLMS